MSRVHCAVLNARPDHFWLTCSQRYGGHGERETPGLIPNPEAKPLSADGTALETGWESRTPPNNTSKGPSIRAGALRHPHQTSRTQNARRPAHKPRPTISARTRPTIGAQNPRRFVHEPPPGAATGQT